MLVRFLYNLLLSVGVIVFAPILFVKVILTPKHRSRFLGRFGLARWEQLPAGRPRIWVHALSVGEVASAQPLLRGLRDAYPDGAILLSTTTAAGECFARASLAHVVDSIVPFPFDLPWSVNRVVDRLRPELFILVETDFWPNLLAGLTRKAVPCLLVNGRISARSFARYTRFPWFFIPLFRSFRMLAMQAEQDVEAMARLGVPRKQLMVLGNLKYEAALPDQSGKGRLERADLGIAPQKLVWVAGSTHPGEEEVVLVVYQHLRQTHPELFLVIAPRNIQRRDELLALAARHGITASCRSEGGVAPGPLLFLDTLGELAAVYGLCDVAFVGGSLVAERGHNPLEAAAHGKPVLFGPSMEDFVEIGHDLVTVGGAWQVVDGEELGDRMEELLASSTLRGRMGEAAQCLVNARQGVAARHLDVIRGLLAEGARDASST